MTPLFDKSNPIQPNELSGYQSVLQRTQGNILKGHGRKQTINLFLSFKGDAIKLKEVIHGFVSKVTSAWVQSQQTLDFKENRVESLFVGFGLSSSGYVYLGYDLSGFPSKAFRGGMARNDSGLGDPPTSTWEEKYRLTPDAIILLAHNDPDALDVALIELICPFHGLADIAIERGIAIYDGGEPVEHFGFVDGISQPLFFQSDVPQDIYGWDPSAGTCLVLAKDPMVDSVDDCGSYFVFRKLRQDVAGFKKKEACLQSKLTPGQDPNLAGALVVGRFRDGTPVAKYRLPQGKKPENNFFYAGNTPSSGAVDPYEKRCPVSAHIRKMNPRGDTDDIKTERTRRIARRGITYGIQDRDAEVGLLFQCCQNSLEDQFEFLQGVWSNQIKKPSPASGLDPVAGESKGSNQNWALLWGTGCKVELDFGGFVTLRGGGYFFLPSVTFLRQM